MGKNSAIFAIFMIGLLILSGCGGQDNTTGTSSTNSTDNNETASTAPEPTSTSNTATSANNASTSQTATSTPPESSLKDRDCITEFIPVKQHVEEVLLREGLPGGGLLIMRDDKPLCRVFYGSFSEYRPVRLVSAAKWLSAATIMTLVDDGLLSLDEPISTYLDYLYGDHGKITMRQLLSHTSGLPMYTDCMFEPRITLEGCTYEISRLPLEADPGTEFIYSGVGYSLAGHVAEAVTGKFWAEIFQERMAEPLGLELTNYGATRNPMLSEGYVVSTMDEYAKFLQMIYHDGIYNGQRILSSEAIDEIFKDYAQDVILTESPAGPNTSYGLGVWRSLINDEGEAQQISSPGGGGFVPWIDFQRGYIGIFMIEARIEPVYNDIIGVQLHIREVFDSQIDVEN